MITQDGFTFTGPAGIITGMEPPSSQVVRGEFFGVRGESHILGETQGRQLTCEYRFQGYTTLAELVAAVNAVNSMINRLTGVITQTVDGSTATHPASTFLGFQSSGPGFYDGSACNKWIEEGRLIWQQRSRI